MGPTSKIAVGWTLIIAGGLGAFVVARNAVIGNRKVMMERRQKIKEQAEKEGAIEFERRRRENASKFQPSV